jgi:hypothetical protein
MARLVPEDEDITPAEKEKAAMAPTPTLLPDLMFHDLVFGHELGTGSFSSVKYAKLIIRGKPASAWPEYAVKVISTDLIRRLGVDSGCVCDCMAAPCCSCVFKGGSFSWQGTKPACSENSRCSECLATRV